MKIDKLFAAIAFLVGFIACSTSRCEQPEQCYELQKLDGLLFAEVEFNGETLRFIVDTGSSCNAICVSYQDQLSDIQTSQSFPDRTAAPIEFKVGPFISNTKHRVAIIDLRPLKNAFGHRIDGILGLPFFAQRTLTFSRSASLIEGASKSLDSREGFRRLKISSDDFGLLYVSAESLGLPLTCDQPLLIDSGSHQMLSVDGQTFTKMLSQGNCTLRPSRSASMIVSESTNELTVNISRMAAISVKGLGRNLEVFEERECSAGLPLLEDFSVQIDFANNYIWAKLPYQR